MTRNELIEQIKRKNSFLSIGLDTDIQKIPKHLLSHTDPVFEFNKQIIDATHDFCVAYKINTAFYEANGVSGWTSLVKTWEYIPPHLFTIADAKRGDIGNTSSMYAKAFFDKESSGMSFDAITVAPYMGEDSVTPFLQYKNKWVILLALTSNKGSEDFQTGKEELFKQVINKSQRWGTADNMMYVVGATHPEMVQSIRTLAPDHFFLVPGIGTQGGDLRAVIQNGMNKDVGLLLNVSRQIIYASAEKDFAEKARAIAKSYSSEMEIPLSNSAHFK